MDASQNTGKCVAQTPIPAFSDTSQHVGIPDQQPLSPFFRAD
jgi:hypothetical protein